MKTTTTTGNATITTTHEGHNLVEAILIGGGRKVDAYKKANGNWVVSLEKANDDFYATTAKVLRTYEMNTAEFFAYWDKKLNEWK